MADIQALVGRFVALARDMQVPAEPFIELVSTLEAEFTRSFMVLVSAGGQLGACTWGEDQDFVDRAVAVFDALGVPENEVQRFASSADYLGASNLFVALLVDGDGDRQLRWFQRRRPTLDQFEAISEGSGDPASTTAAARALAAAMGKDDLLLHGRSMGAYGLWTLASVSTSVATLGEAGQVASTALGALGLNAQLGDLPAASTSMSVTALLGPEGQTNATVNLDDPDAKAVLPFLEEHGGNADRLSALFQAHDLPSPLRLDLTVGPDGMTDAELVFQFASGSPEESQAPDGALFHGSIDNKPTHQASGRVARAGERAYALVGLVSADAEWILDVGNLDGVGPRELSLRLTDQNNRVYRGVCQGRVVRHDAFHEVGSIQAELHSDAGTVLVDGLLRFLPFATESTDGQLRVELNEALAGPADARFAPYGTQWRLESILAGEPGQALHVVLDLENDHEGRHAAVQGRLTSTRADGGEVERLDFELSSLSARLLRDDGELRIEFDGHLDAESNVPIVGVFTTEA